MRYAGPEAIVQRAILVLKRKYSEVDMSLRCLEFV